MRCVTPKQTCPRPNGFGCNLSSKTRWFTGFCNSHQVSHFATFFIDARAEISVAESLFRLQKKHRSPRCTPRTGHEGQAIDSSIPWRFSGRGSLVALHARWARAPGTGGGTRPRCQSTPPARTPQLLNTFVGSFCCACFDNDPSTGLPTETLLRLVLPLNDKDQLGSIPHRRRRRMSPACPRGRRRIQGERDRRLQGASYGEIGDDEGPMPTASTTSENSARRSRTMTSHDEAREAWDARAAFRFALRTKYEGQKEIDKT
ncbi:hypothetical protein CQW23_32685 [Capsicum baccatum]|uniref:Uncharacterized protein n=1 Tax=Capsicum baccatum TaxID=33114 RepID=A0A2G2V3Y9_CAPBA|nr:hypothetical protein CQW23_32685 [Capsicum baccatum]